MTQDTYTAVDPTEMVGHLTPRQYARLERAIDTARTLVPWLYAAGHITTEQAGRTKRSEAPLPIPATWVAAHTIDDLLNRLQPWDDLRDAAADMQGQWLCRCLWQEVESAARNWPVEEKPHQVVYVRCRQCGRLALEWQPPAFAGDDIRVVCTMCGHLETPEMVAWDARLVIDEHAAARKARPLESTRACL